MASDPKPLQLISTRAEMSGLQWQLPRRPWGKAKVMPWIVMTIGVLPIALFGIGPSSTLPNFSQDTFDAVFDSIWLLGECIATLLGLALITVGLFLWLGGTTITLSQEKLTTRDHFGPFRWTRQLDARRINEIEVSIGTTSTNGGPDMPTNNVTALIAKLEPADKPTKRKLNFFVIAWGYPKDWMLQLGDAIKVEATRAVPHLADLEVTAQVVSDGDDFDQPEQPHPEPEDNNVRLTRDANSLTFNIPPSGLMRGTKGLGCFTVMWNGFILFFIGMMLITMLFDDHPNVSGPDDPLMFLFLLPFIAIGIGMALYTIHLGRSNATIVVIGKNEDAVIAYHRISPVRKPRDLTWAATELTHIRVDDSSMSVNDQPIQELQFHPLRGKKVGLLAQLDDDVLRWIAWELRKQTGLPSRFVKEPIDASHAFDDINA